MAKGKKGEKKEGGKSSKKKEKELERKRKEEEALELQKKLERERLIALRNEARERENLLIKEHEIRIDKLNISCELITDIQIGRIERTINLKEEELWTKYVNCVRKPNSDDFNNLSFYLHLWQNKTDSDFIDNVIEKFGEVIELVDEIEDNMDDPILLTSYIPLIYHDVKSLWKEYRDKLYLELFKRFDRATYFILQDVDINMKDKELEGAKYEHDTPYFTLLLWSRIRPFFAREFPSDIEQIIPKINFPNAGVTVKVPYSLAYEYYAVRATRFKYDQYSVRSETFEAKPMPDKFTRNLYQYNFDQFEKRQNLKREYEEEKRYRKELRRKKMQQQGTSSSISGPSKKSRESQDTKSVDSLRLSIDECNSLTDLEDAGTTVVEKPSKSFSNQPHGEPGGLLPVSQPLGPLKEPSEIILLNEENDKNFLKKYLKYESSKEKKFMINLRKYIILGGTYHIDFLHAVPQPRLLSDKTKIAVRHGEDNITHFPIDMTINCVRRKLYRKIDNMIDQPIGEEGSELAFSISGLLRSLSDTSVGKTRINFFTDWNFLTYIRRQSTAQDEFADFDCEEVPLPKMKKSQYIKFRNPEAIPPIAIQVMVEGATENLEVEQEPLADEEAIVDYDDEGNKFDFKQCVPSESDDDDFEKEGDEGEGDASKKKKEEKETTEVKEEVKEEDEQIDWSTYTSSRDSEETMTSYSIKSLQDEDKIEDAESKDEYISTEYEEINFKPLVKILFPKNILWFEKPLPVLWDEKTKVWSNEDAFSELQYEDDDKAVSFRLNMLNAPIGFAQTRYITLPFKEWHLQPDLSTVPAESVCFSLRTSKFAIEFTIQPFKVCVKSFQLDEECLEQLPMKDSMKEILQDKIGIFYKPYRFIRILEKIGVDIFPMQDGYIYMKELVPKDWICENHTYECMAMASTTHEFRSSRWNLTAANKTMLFNFKEIFECSFNTNFNLTLVTPERAKFVKCSDDSEEFTEDEREGQQFFPDLYWLIQSNCCSKTKKKLKNASLALIDTVYIMLFRTRILSFS